MSREGEPFARRASGIDACSSAFRWREEACESHKNHLLLRDIVQELRDEFGKSSTLISAQISRGVIHCK